ncbi:MAG: hypothetical protein ACM336_21535 [Acidobacteriota bacterium]
MKLPRFAPVVLLALFASSALSQNKVALRNMYDRLLCIVPMTGAGTPEDPRRPLYAPVPTPGAPPSRDGIIAFSFQESENGQYALVEFVARDRAAFKEILEDSRVKSFERGRHKKDDIEKEFRKLRKDFDLSAFQVGAL